MALSAAAISAIASIASSLLQNKGGTLQPPITPATSQGGGFTPAPTTAEVIPQRLPIQTTPIAVPTPSAGQTVPVGNIPIAQVPSLDPNLRSPELRGVFTGNTGAGTTLPSGELQSPQTQAPKTQGLDFKSAAKEFGLEALKNIAFRQRPPLPSLNPVGARSSFQGSVDDPFTRLAKLRAARGVR